MLETPKHRCAAHVVGCNAQIEPKYLMCRAHWAMVPHALQTEIWREYFSGHRKGTHPKDEYIAAVARAVTFIRAKKEAA